MLITFDTLYKENGEFRKYAKRYGTNPETFNGGTKRLVLLEYNNIPQITLS